MAAIEISKQLEKWNAQPVPVEATDLPPTPVEGVGETLDLVKFLLALVVLIKLAASKGWSAILTLTVQTSALIFNLVKAVVGINKVPAELADLDSKERGQIVAVVDEVVIFEDSAKMESLVDRAIIWALDTYSLIRDFLAAMR